MASPFTRKALAFLRALQRNNDREWFRTRKGIDAPICQDTRSGGLDELLASAKIGHDSLVDLSRAKTFQAPDDLPFGSAVRRAACDVGGELLLSPVIR